MRVRTDIHIDGSRIRLSQRVSRLLGLSSGMVLVLWWGGDEVYLGAAAAEADIMGRLYYTHGGYRCSNAAVARELAKGRGVCAYRCGDVVELDGRRMVTIITRKNYANEY